MTLNDLYELINLLTKKEREKLQKAFSAEKREFVLCGKLFNALILSKDRPSESEINSKLYSKALPPSEQAHKKLLYRLRTKILDVFYDCIYEISEELDEIDVASFKINKLIGQVHALHVRGVNSKLVSKLRDEIIRIALKYEFYQILIGQLELQKISKSLLDGEIVVRTFNKKIQRFRDCYHAVCYSFELDSLLKHQSMNFSSPSSKRLKEVEVNRDRLFELFEKTKSPLIKYFYLFHDFYLSNEKQDYLKATDVGITLLRLVNNSPSLKRRQRIAIINSNLAIPKINIAKYKEAVTHSIFANQIFKKDTKSYYLTMGSIFFASFYDGNLLLAEEAVKYMRGQWKNKVNEFEHGKLDVYQSYIDFRKEDYSSALNKLLTLDKVLEDKEGWGFTTRVFTLLIFLLQNKEDSATAAFENLQRQYYRIIKNKELRKRDIVIYKVLLHLYNQGFNLTKSEKVLFLKHELERKADHQWEHLTAELIPFEKLLEQKYKALRGSDSMNVA